LGIELGPIKLGHFARKSHNLGIFDEKRLQNILFEEINSTQKMLTI